MIEIAGMKATKKDLPVSWRWVKLGELIRETKAGFACGQRDLDGIAQLRMNNLDTRGNFVWNDVLRVPRESNDTDQYLLVSGDVLFNNTNSTELVGKSALFEGYTEPLVYSNHFTRLRTKKEILIPDFLASWLNLQWQQGVFAAICNRWIGQSAVKADKLFGLDFPLPPLPEQRRIAEILREQMAAVEKARGAAEARLEAVKAMPAAFLRKIFPQPGKPLPKGWSYLRLGDVAETTSGSTPSRSNREYFGGNIPWVKTGELCDDEITQADEQVTKVALEKCSLPLLPPESLLIAMYGQGQTRGRTGLLKIQATTNQACFAIFPNEKVFSPPYLQAWFRDNYLRIRAGTENRGGNQPNLNGQIIRDMIIPFPPLSEQLQIIALLKDKKTLTEKALKAAEEELNTINAIPAALLRRAFNGDF